MEGIASAASAMAGESIAAVPAADNERSHYYRIYDDGDVSALIQSRYRGFPPMSGRAVTFGTS